MTVNRDLGPTGTPSNPAQAWTLPYYTQTRASSRFVAAVDIGAGNFQFNHVYGFGQTGTETERGRPVGDPDGAGQPFATASWNAGDRVEASWMGFSANQSVTVSIGLRSGPITSYSIYPQNISVSPSIAAGLLFITVPQDTRLLIEVNGNTKDTLCVFNDPLQTDLIVDPTPGNSTIVTVSSQAQLASLYSSGIPGGTISNYLVVVLEPGIYFAPTVANTARAPLGGDYADIRRELDHMLLPFGPFCVLHLKRGAWFVGSFDMRASNNMTITGPGVISGEWSTYSDLLNKLQSNQNQYQSPPGVGGNFLTFSEQVAWDAFIGTTYNDNDFTFPDNDLSNVTVVGTPFHTSAGPFNTFTRVKIISHWYFNNDGLTGLALNPSNGTRSSTNCFVMSGDDAAVLDFNFGKTYVTNCHLIAYGGAPIQLGYFSQPPDTFDLGNTRVVTNCVVQSRAHNIPSGRDLFTGKTTAELIPANGTNNWSVEDQGPTSNWYQYGPYAAPASYTESIIKLWVDGSNSDPSTWGKFNCTVDGLRVEGAVPRALFTIENCFYPFGAVSSQNLSQPLQEDKAGNAANIVLKNITVAQTPQWRSRLIGRDKQNTPHDVYFSNVIINGVLLTGKNWDQFVWQNWTPYNIFVEGRALVTAIDICNLALSHIGESAVVSSISPPDGSAQASYCNQFFNRAVEELLEMHPWSFATTRNVLSTTPSNDVEGWEYSYQYPNNVVQALQVIPEGEKETFKDPKTNSQAAYTIEQNPAGSMVLYCDVENAELRYTKFVYTPGHYPPLFISALSWLLASKLAGPIMKGDVGAAEAKRCLQNALFYVGRAASSDSNQRNSEVYPKHVAPWMSQR